MLYKAPLAPDAHLMKNHCFAASLAYGSTDVCSIKRGNYLHIYERPGRPGAPGAASADIVPGAGAAAAATAAEPGQARRIPPAPEHTRPPRITRELLHASIPFGLFGKPLFQSQ